MTQYSWRLRDQYVQRPVVSVRCSASSSIQPTISTSPVSYCCATAGTRPSASRLSREAIFGSRFDGRTASVIVALFSVSCTLQHSARRLPSNSSIAASPQAIHVTRDLLAG